MLLLLRLPRRNHAFTREVQRLAHGFAMHVPQWRRAFCHVVDRPLPSVAMPFDVMNMFSRCFLGLCVWAKFCALCLQCFCRAFAIFVCEQ